MATHDGDGGNPDVILVDDSDDNRHLSTSGPTDSSGMAAHDGQGGYPNAIFVDDSDDNRPLFTSGPTDNSGDFAPTLPEPIDVEDLDALHVSKNSSSFGACIDDWNEDSMFEQPVRRRYPADNSDIDKFIRDYRANNRPLEECIREYRELDSRRRAEANNKIRVEEESSPVVEESSSDHEVTCKSSDDEDINSEDENFCIIREPYIRKGYTSTGRYVGPTPNNLGSLWTLENSIPSQPLPNGASTVDYPGYGIPPSGRLLPRPDSEAMLLSRSPPPGRLMSRPDSEARLLSRPLPLPSPSIRPRAPVSHSIIKVYQRSPKPSPLHGIRSQENRIVKSKPATRTWATEVKVAARGGKSASKLSYANTDDVSLLDSANSKPATRKWATEVKAAPSTRRSKLVSKSPYADSDDDFSLDSAKIKPATRKLANEAKAAPSFRGGKSASKRPYADTDDEFSLDSAESKPATRKWATEAKAAPSIRRSKLASKSPYADTDDASLLDNGKTPTGSSTSRGSRRSSGFTSGDNISDLTSSDTPWGLPPAPNGTSAPGSSGPRTRGRAAADRAANQNDSLRNVTTRSSANREKNSSNSNDSPVSASGTPTQTGRPSGNSRNGERISDPTGTGTHTTRTYRRRSNARDNSASGGGFSMDGVDDRNTSFLQDVVTSPPVNGPVSTQGPPMQNGTIMSNNVSLHGTPMPPNGRPMQNLQMQTNSGNIVGADDEPMPVAGNLSNGAVAKGNAPS
ncbi:hypothetical protein V490_03079 [Pseudogymnoascus sp. VKM F-3557]|nr:hypothetical protein V490_03079 [Pseudogymnoascus sp. VKM F-3557]